MALYKKGILVYFLYSHDLVLARPSFKIISGTNLLCN